MYNIYTRALKRVRKKEISIVSVVTIPHPFRGIRNGSERASFTRNRELIIRTRLVVRFTRGKSMVFAAPGVFITLRLSQLRVRVVVSLYYYLKPAPKQMRILLLRKIESARLY